MDFFEQNEHKATGIFLTSRHLSWLIASAIFLSFFVFMAGYFLGKKKGAEKFYQKVEQDSLADQISSSMYTLYDVTGKTENPTQDEQEVAELDAPQIDQKQSSSTATEIPVLVQATPLVLAEPTQRFYAQLAGFGTLKTAEQFVQKLQKNHVAVKVNKRESKTAKGKVIYWYQVVTDMYPNKSELQATLELIKKVERLKGIQIKTC